MQKMGPKMLICGWLGPKCNKPGSEVRSQLPRSLAASRRFMAVPPIYAYFWATLPGGKSLAAH
jgi:hypothetical protein